MFVMDCYGHKLSNGVLFAHHLILDVPGGSSHLAYRRRVGISHNPRTRVNRTRNTKNAAYANQNQLRFRLFYTTTFLEHKCKDFTFTLSTLKI